MIREMLKTTLAALRSAFCSRAVLLAENVSSSADRRAATLVAKPGFGRGIRVVPPCRSHLRARWSGSHHRTARDRPSVGIVPSGGLIWRRKSQGQFGRPPADADLRVLIGGFWTENPLWGEDRIGRRAWKAWLTRFRRGLSKPSAAPAAQTVGRVGPRSAQSSPSNLDVRLLDHRHVAVPDPLTASSSVDLARRESCTSA